MSSSRQLAAIMFTDIVGYTALMGRDEEMAFTLLKKNRELQKPVISKFNGRWIKEIGDGILASFNTVSDAVNAAAEIQHACNAAKEFQLRIGIHLGEVVFENDDVFGDGVNIASRLQTIAKPGGIYISESVYNNISNKSDFSTRFVKEELLKNLKEPIKIYEIITDNESKQANKEINRLQEKSIAVLPFVNMSNDPEQEYFCDGISEEIINVLTQLNNLRVISRSSAFAFKGKNVDVREVGKTLDVTTLLEGSVRKSNNQLRITTKLVRASDGSHLWSDRYDHKMENVFAIQENIAENVAIALQGFLTNAEKEAIKRPETSIEAYEYFLKGREYQHRLLLYDAKEWFEKAIAQDPAYAPAYAGLAAVLASLYEWYGSHDADLEAAERHSLKALSLAPELAESHSSRGFVLSLGEHYDESEKEFKEAIRLNPNSFDAYYYYGRLCFSRGQIRQSADLFQKASEVRREDFQSALLQAQSLRVLGEDYQSSLREGIERARKQLELNPNDRRALSLTSSYFVDVGEREEGMKWITKALELYPDDTGVLVNAACMYATDGNKEMALQLLEKVFGKGFGKKDWIEHDPDYDSLRDEPRFKALLNKLK